MLIQGRQSTNEVTPVLVDSLGQVLVAGSSPSYLNPTGVISQYASAALPAGISFHNVINMPSNQRWIINLTSIVYIGVVAGVTALFYAQAGFQIVEYANFVNGLLQSNNHQIVIEPSWTINVRIFGATAGDTFQAQIFSRRIL